MRGLERGGAGLGLLFAPQPGTETRRQVRHYAKRAQHEATRFGRSVKTGVDRAIERGDAAAAQAASRRLAELMEGWTARARAHAATLQPQPVESGAR